MRVAFGSDERSAVTEHLVAVLRARGLEVTEVPDGTAWPEVGRMVGEAVASGEATFGVVCCTTGTGVSIAANKVPGIRAALCTDAATAQGARRWNDANVLALSLRLTSSQLAEEIVDAFMSASFDPDESATVARVEAG
ncbi:MAG TPA: RpiB/LacA/LacB family sugar-phosphate isomerase [Acidimicrobiales bacterium]|nr:RpiB/LacA/LacB family sugar-phosphate isomerase [Acidimicrobiales bacterium]